MNTNRLYRCCCLVIVYFPWGCAETQVIIFQSVNFSQSVCVDWFERVLGTVLLSFQSLVTLHYYYLGIGITWSSQLCTFLWDWDWVCVDLFLSRVTSESVSLDGIQCSHRKGIALISSCFTQWPWSTIHSSPVSFSVCPKWSVGDVSQVPYLVISICATHSSSQTHTFPTCPTSIHQSPVVVEGITSAIQLDEEFVLYSTPGDVCCWDRMSVKVGNGTVTVVIQSEQECHEDQQQRLQ